MRLLQFALGAWVVEGAGLALAAELGPSALGLALGARAPRVVFALEVAAIYLPLLGAALQGLHRASYRDVLRVAGIPGLLFGAHALAFLVWVRLPVLATPEYAWEIYYLAQRTFSATWQFVPWSALLHIGLWCCGGLTCLRYIASRDVRGRGRFALYGTRILLGLLVAMPIDATVQLASGAGVYRLVRAVGTSF